MGWQSDREGQAFLPVQKERGKGEEGMAFILS